MKIRLSAASQAQASAAFDALAARFVELNRDWYAWGDGELGAVNRTLASASSAPVSPSLALLLRKARDYTTRTGGLFNVCTGRLTQTWGLHELPRSGIPRIPDAEDIAAARLAARCDLTIDPAGLRVSVAHAGVIIDLGGIAKGAILGIAVAILKQSGIDRALIDVGGDLAAIADAPATPFRIGLRDARSSTPLGAIELGSGEAVMSSGDYARYFEVDGKRYQHILDPRSGYPVATRAATVIHRDPVLADVAATALVVGGATQFSSVCDALGVSTALLIDKLGNMVNTDAMRQRLEVLPA
ncbi:MAG: FAD:protein FMN transferase [Pseudomonadota bacterium]